MLLLLFLVAAANAEQCLLACQRDYRPVCGSDGVTYSNECQLTSFNCFKRTAVAVAYQGECIEAQEPVCNVACTLQNEPVCGTNAVTYGNLCQLEADACLKRTSIAVQHVGECVEQKEEAVCNVACQMQWMPVCGTDAVTYGNLCMLESEACLKRTSIAVQHEGACIPVPAPAETCNIACTMQWEPVCGTDSVTYGNLCQLESEACLKRTSIAVQHVGECVAEQKEEAVCNVACQMQWMPVCGTDAVTYGNLCMLESEACLKRTSIAVQHEGVCIPVPEEESCNVACTLQWEPVCGTNAVTYGNLCMLESDACLRRSEVTVAHMGMC